METSLYFIPTDQNSISNPNEIIKTEPPPHKSRGRKPGTKTNKQNQIKKQRLRGMGVAQLERAIAEEEKKQMGDTSAPPPAAANPNATRLPVLVPDDPVVVLQGFPSYGGGPNGSAGCNRNRLYCGSGQILMDPVCSSPWGRELSSLPNPNQAYYYNNASNNRCDTCLKKKRLDGDYNNVIGSNGGGFSKYSMAPSPMMNGYDHFIQEDDQRSQGFFYDQRIARTASASTNNTVRIEEIGSRSPRNGAGGVKEYEFFPGKYVGFSGKYGKTVSVDTSLGEYCTNTSTIDLSLKL
ncbi:unnamed protein product [Cochlearia groenlandica]